MKVVKERIEDKILSRVIYNTIEEFDEDMTAAFWAAEQNNTVVEIWSGGDYFTLEYHSLEAEEESE